MKKGEVWRARLPPAVGHAQAGERPAVIVENEPFLSALPTVLLVPFTGQIAASRFPGTVVVQPDGQNGLSVPSVALVFQLTAQDKQILLYRMGELAPDVLDQIVAIIQAMTS